MDIDNHVSGIVQTIISQITTQVQQQVALQINQKINDIIANLDTTSVLADQLSKKLDARISQLPIDAKSIEAQLISRLDSLSSTIGQTVQEKSVTTTLEAINKQINGFDFQQLCQAAITAAIQNQSFTYPDLSIPGNAINVEGWVISGNSIKGGIIEQFGSTGIDDKSTACQLTIMDDITVVENNLLTKDLTVKGTVTVEGDLNVTGTFTENSPAYVQLVASTTQNVRTSLDQTLFKNYADMVFTQVKENGLDLNKITLNGTDIVDGNTLSNSILNSNLQKVGQLKELQVSGETLLSGSLYTTVQRVGVNTIEPAQALSIWDQEVEIGIGKQSNNTGVIGTPRSQTLILSTNGKNNITLTPDGAASVTQLNIGTVSITSSDMPPSDDRPKGTIVFNSNPNLGGPLGWVSLGDARWANFGIID
jgi:hypothetical protein